MDTDECISGVTTIVVLTFLIECVDFFVSVVYDVVSLAEVLCIELLDTLYEVKLSVECAVVRVVAVG